MQEQLSKISEGFLREKSLSSEDVKNRISELNQYMSMLDKVASEIVRVSLLHKKEVEDVISEKISHEKRISDLKVEHLTLSKSHDKVISDKLTHSSNLSADIRNLESKSTSLDNRIEGLLTELKNNEERSIEMRGVVSTLERAVRNLQADEILLKKSVGEKRDEESKLIASIEASKKEVTRLSNDLAILEARKKK